MKKVLITEGEGFIGSVGHSDRSGGIYFGCWVKIKIKDLSAAVEMTL
jgi:hypothetical protein